MELEPQTFLLGAFIYRQAAPDPSDDIQPVMARIHAYTLHLAKRLLALDILRHGYFVKEIRELSEDYLTPFDDAEWEIP